MCVPDGLLHRLADYVGGGSGLGEGRQADHPLNRLVGLPAGAQQVEERGQKNDLQIKRVRFYSSVNAGGAKLCLAGVLPDSGRS